MTDKVEFLERGAEVIELDVRIDGVYIGVKMTNDEFRKLIISGAQILKRRMECGLYDANKVLREADGTQ